MKAQVHNAAQHQSPTFIQFVGMGMKPLCVDHPNMTVVGDGKSLLTRKQIAQAADEISKQPGPKIAIIRAHGFVADRGSENEAHVQTFTEERNEALAHRLSQSREDFPADKAIINLTLENILAIMDAHPDHIDLVSCFGGAAYHDVKRNFDVIVQKMKSQGKTSLTICELGSSKYPVTAEAGNSYSKDVIDHTTLETDPLVERVRVMGKITETLNVQRIIIGEDSAPKLLAFKIKAPKTIDSINHPEAFIGSWSMYGDKIAGKAQRKECQVVTMDGKDGDKDHDELRDQIIKTLSANGKEFSKQYIANCMSLACTRDKPTLVECWLEKLPLPERSNMCDIALASAANTGILLNQKNEVASLLYQSKYHNHKDFPHSHLLRYAIKVKSPEDLHLFLRNEEDKKDAFAKVKKASELKFLIDNGLDPKFETGKGRWCDLALLEEAKKPKLSQETIDTLLEVGADPKATNVLEVAAPEARVLIEAKMREVVARKEAIEIGRGMEDFISSDVVLHGVAAKVKSKDAGVDLEH